MKRNVWQEKYKKLSKELKSIRITAGFTQSELSQLIDKPQSYVSKYENGDRYLDFIEVLTVCQACNHNPAQLTKKLGFSFNDSEVI